MPPGQDVLKGNMPTLVLAVLQENPLHGYAIARAIEQRSQGVLHCKEGTLYPTLHTLEQEGLICGEWQQIDKRRERKVYRIMPAGRAAFEEQRGNWIRITSAIGQVMGGLDHATEPV